MNEYCITLFFRYDYSYEMSYSAHYEKNTVHSGAM